MLRRCPTSARWSLATALGLACASAPTAASDLATSAPPSDVRAASPAPADTCGPGLGKAELAAVIVPRRRQVNACLEALTSCTFVVRLEIAASGRVDHVVVDQRGSPAPDARADACIRRTIGRWRFPRALASSRVTLPFWCPRG